MRDVILCYFESLSWDTLFSVEYIIGESIISSNET